MPCSGVSVINTSSSTFLVCKLNASIMKTSKYFIQCLFFLLLIIVIGCKKDPPKTLPEVSTTTISNITSTTASSGGTITDDGNSPVSSRGVCWSTNENPTISEKKTSDGSGEGSFSSSITGLSPGKSYYVRAYATNLIGTAYGNQVSMKTASILPTVTTNDISEVTSSSAKSGGNITDDGGSPVTARGVCWSTNQNPTITDSKTSDGVGIGTFTSSITGLLPSGTYYARAYATNDVGTAYGTQITILTTIELSVLTANMLGIASTTATVSGNITSDGGAAVIARGVCWSRNAMPIVRTDSTTNNGLGTGEFTSSITDLSPGKTYYFRAYATNSVGTAYSNQLTANTSAVLPILTTREVVGITPTTATSGGNITNDGGSTITARGVCWSRSQEPTISDNKTTNGTGTGIFTSSITDLTPGETYYLRAYATNGIGTAYGNQLTFIAAIATPSITTTAVSSITPTTATSGGNITSDCGAAVIARGVCWSTNQNPTTLDTKTNNGMGTGTFTSSITNLAPGTTYYLKAYATNSVGTSYGEQVTFSTPAILPTVTTVAVTDITLESAISGGNITSDGGATVTSRGICWSTSQNPTVDNNKTTNGAGKGTFVSNLTNLTPNTTYYVRAYAINNKGISYGGELIFSTISLNDYGLGGVPLKESEIESVPITLAADIKTGAEVKSSYLPPYVELDIPEAKDQGRIGACTAFATGYGLMSYLYKHFLGFNSYSNDVLFAPFYLYSQRSERESDRGMSIFDALETLSKQGICSLPFFPNETYSLGMMPDINAIRNASEHKINSYTSLEKNINEVKEYLSKGYPLVISIKVDISFLRDDLTQFTKSNDGRYIWKKNSSIYDTLYHSVLVCGYDDGIQAFNILNSWGPNWANSGHFWIDYDWFKKAVTQHGLRWEVFCAFVKRPNISTKIAYDITNSSVISGGTILYDWDLPVIEKGICWSTISNPSIYNSKINAGSGNDNYTVQITTLNPGTKYYLKAYAINENGISYGKEISSTTTEAKIPTITTTPITIYSSTSATVGGNITDNGGANVTEHGIFWSTNPLVNGSKLKIESGDAVFSGTLTGLTPSTTYYVKAYAINSQGIGYGREVNFTTVAGGIAPVAAFSANPTTIKEEESVQFTDQSTNNPTSWSWDFGDGGTSNVQNPSHTYSNFGKYTVKLTTANSFGSDDITKSDYIIVNSASGILFNDDLTYGSVTDIDGNVYKTIQIGTQTWMAENLKVTRYNNGDVIPTANNINEFVSPYKYQWPCKLDDKNLAIYGRLYTGYVLQDTRNLCPNGWHVPTVEEWQTLGYFVGGIYESSGGNGMVGAGAHLKEIGTTHWREPNSDATNKYGFTAMPGGWIYSLNNESFGEYGSYFTSTTSYWNGHKHHVDFWYNSGTLRVPIPGTTQGHNDIVARAIRCIKD